MEPEPTPAQLVAVTGGAPQTATVGTAVAVVPTVRVLSNQGQPMANVTVAFTVTGGGTVGAASAQTNAEGIASPGSWTLGSAPGENTLTATVGTLTARFTATGQPAPSTSTTLQAAQVDAGAWAQCARTAAGQISCWGANDLALVGDGTVTFREFPTAVAVSGVAFADVSVGLTNACALTTTGAAYCWGSGNSIGDGTFGEARRSPTAVSGSHVFTKIAVGSTTACALKADGTAWCWGNTSPSDAGSARRVPTLVSSTLRFTDVAAGSSPTGAQTDYNCGIATDGATYCWGITGIGDPAQVTVNAAQAPAVLGGGVAFRSLALGRNHACGLTADGTAHCWGVNEYGQVGDGTSGNVRATPVPVSGSTRFAAIAAGGAHSCGRTSDGALFCWGLNSTGALGTGVVGNGTSILAPIPTPQAVAAPSGVTFASVATGLANTCAVATTSSDVYCWGTRATSNPSINIADPAPVVVRTR